MVGSQENIYVVGMDELSIRCPFREARATCHPQTATASEIHRRPRNRVTTRDQHRASTQREFVRQE